MSRPLVDHQVVDCAGLLAGGVAAQSAADGYTLLFGGIGELTIAPHLGEVPDDPTKDFTPDLLAGGESMADCVFQIIEMPDRSGARQA